MTDDQRAGAGEALKACPFCGCTPALPKEATHVWCPDCGVTMFADNNKEAREAWNRRAPESRASDKREGDDVERVARELHAIDRETYEGRRYEDEVESERECFRREARRILAALSQPKPAEKTCRTCEDSGWYWTGGDEGEGQRLPCIACDANRKPKPAGEAGGCASVVDAVRALRAAIKEVAVDPFSGECRITTTETAWMGLILALSALPKPAPVR